jgi:hypothetical protein
VSHVWTPKRDEYYIRTGSMFENPHGVPHDEIVRMILDNPPEVVAQTVFGKYVESSGIVFSGELIQQMIDRSLPRVLGESWIADGARETAAEWYRRRGRDWGQRYHAGIDFARQTDYTVVTVIDTLTKPARLVYYRRLNRVAWESIYAEVGRARAYFGPNILADSTGPGGDAAMDALESRTYCPVHHKTLLAGTYCTDDEGNRSGCHKHYLSLSCVDGFHFTGPTKKDLVDHLRVVLSVGQEPRNPEKPFGWLRVPQIPQLEEELTFYTWDDKKLMTDCLFSLALAAWSGLEDEIHEALEESPYGT